jgi:hypothetical protein
MNTAPGNLLRHHQLAAIERMRAELGPAAVKKIAVSA